MFYRRQMLHIGIRTRIENFYKNSFLFALPIFLSLVTVRLNVILYNSVGPKCATKMFKLLQISIFSKKIKVF